MPKSKPPYAADFRARIADLAGSGRTTRSLAREFNVTETTIRSAPGTVRRLTPRFSRDYPRSLTAHDIGLKDLLDAFHLLGEPPEVVLCAISVRPPAEPGLGLSEPVAAAVPEVVEQVLRELSNGR